MASVKGPLMSLDASGTVANTITFSKWRGRNYVRVHTIPSNPRSGGQVGNRSMMTFLSQSWSLLPAIDQATWLELAEAENYANFNAYVKYNMHRWTQFDAPMRSPDRAADSIPVMGALNLTVGVRQVSISQVVTNANDIWGVMIFRSITTGYVPGVTDCVGIARHASTPVTYVDTPVDPGTYFYRTIGFSKAGLKTAAVAQVQAIVS